MNDKEISTILIVIAIILAIILVFMAINEEKCTITCAENNLTRYKTIMGRCFCCSNIMEVKNGLL